MRGDRQTHDSLVARVASLPTWYHSIDLGDGLVTPGVWPIEGQKHITAAMGDIDFSDAKVLDVGCLDGRFTFEAERRGAAQVYAVDLLRQTGQGEREPYFRLAAEALGSRAIYDPDRSVYDVAALGIHDFDVVLFLGVYYHVRDPLLAFARLRQVMRDGAVILVEGQVVHSDEVFASFFHRSTFGGDPSNWWVPTVPCLEDWIESSYFSIEEEYPRPPESWGGLEATARHVVRAVAARHSDLHTRVPDPELAPFDPRTAPET